MRRLIFITLLLFKGLTSGICANPILNTTPTKLTNSQDTCLHKAPPFVPVQILKSSDLSIKSYDQTSPNNNISINVSIDNNQITYSVNKNNTAIIHSSLIDLQLSSGNLGINLSSGEAIYSQKNETIQLLYGERNDVACSYNEMMIPCTNGSGVKFNLIVRAYNEGIAFRFNFPSSNNLSTINIKNENIQFFFASNYIAYEESYNEQGYTPRNIQDIDRTLIPLTLTNQSNSICINEACNNGYTRIYLKATAANTLQTNFISSSRNYTIPFSTPWRYVAIADNPEDLIEKKEMLYTLDNHDVSNEDWSWLKPGKVFRCYQLSTQDAYNAIDFCAEMDIPYMMFDAGWYGLGYGQGNEKNPDSNPFEVIAEIDMPAVLSYAEANNIGLILYINKVAWYNYDNMAMFDLYESWGIKGLKLGFVDGYSASGIKKVYEIIKEAANRKMFINVHDEFRPSGQVFSYPNLFTTEGIRGNENRFNTGDHTTLLPYTRFLAGAADYTICFKGQDPNYKFPSVFNTKKAHQLALSIMFYSPLQHIFWYAKPSIYTKPIEIEVFKKIPTTWYDFVVAKGSMGNYYSIARRTGSKWFLATTCNNTASDFYVPLNFLNQNIEYDVEIYSDDDNDNVIKQTFTLSQLKELGEISNNSMHMSLHASGGKVCIFTPKNVTSIWSSQLNSPALKLTPNPAKHSVTIELKDIVKTKSRIKVISIDGRIVLDSVRSFEQGKEVLDINTLQSGLYIITVKNNSQFYSQKLIIE